MRGMVGVRDLAKHLGAVAMRGIAAEVAGQAGREIFACLVTEAGLTKTEMAAGMPTSRQALAPLLDTNGRGLTLETLERAASAVWEAVRISVDDVAAKRERRRCAAERPEDQNQQHLGNGARGGIEPLIPRVQGIGSKA